MNTTDPAKATAGPLPRTAAPRSLSLTDLNRDGLTDFARARLIGLVEDARDSLVGQVRGVRSLAQMLTDAIGSNLGDTAGPVNRMIGSAADTIDTLADRLADKSVEELVEDGRSLVRAQPAAAVGLAIALGFLAGRIIKAAQN